MAAPGRARNLCVCACARARARVCVCVHACEEELRNELLPDESAVSLSYDRAHALEILRCVPATVCLCLRKYVSVPACLRDSALKRNLSPKQNTCLYWKSIKLMRVRVRVRVSGWVGSWGAARNQSTTPRWKSLAASSCTTNTCPPPRTHAQRGCGAAGPKARTRAACVCGVACARARGCGCGCGCGGGGGGCGFGGGGGEQRREIMCAHSEKRRERERARVRDKERQRRRAADRYPPNEVEDGAIGREKARDGGRKGGRESQRACGQAIAHLVGENVG